MNSRADDLACLASSLLADAPPPPRVHDAWRRGVGAESGSAPTNPAVIESASETTGAAGAGPRRRPARAPTFAAAAVLSLIATAGASSSISSPVPGSEGGTTGSESGGGEATPEVDVALTSVIPAIDGAMGELDVSALRDPAAVGECLAAHGEDVDALLGAAPVTLDERVRQLFVLAQGIPGQVSVLVVSEGCGSQPGPPLVHDTIGAPR